VKRALIAFVAGCHTATQAAAPVVPAGPPPTDVQPLPPGPATAVVVLQPNVPTPVLDGPFLVIAINPGTSMDLAVARSHACDGAVWFAYSGGGMAVGKGQTLCARSDASGPRTNGFSGTSSPIAP
jgi:hypothetical protein